jgi:hypothetical protein
MQQDNRKKLGIFIIIIGLIVLIAIIYFGFIKKAAPTDNNLISPNEINNQLPSGTDSGQVPATEIPREVINYDLSREAPHKVNANDVAQISMAFAERFGSYSNQSSYGNFTDLKIMMTSNMKDWADKNVSDLKASSSNSKTYYGIITNALTSEIKNFDDERGSAQIIITTKRQESAGIDNPREAYVQKLELDFKKINGEWLVDRAYWEK